jgi:hypothetical protein
VPVGHGIAAEFDECVVDIVWWDRGANPIQPSLGHGDSLGFPQDVGVRGRCARALIGYIGNLGLPSGDYGGAMDRPSVIVLAREASMIALGGTSEARESCDQTRG